MFTCDGCWDNPCTCGKRYRHMSRGDRAALADVLMSDDMPRGMAPADGFPVADGETAHDKFGEARAEIERLRAALKNARTYLIDIGKYLEPHDTIVMIDSALEQKAGERSDEK